MWKQMIKIICLAKIRRLTVEGIENTLINTFYEHHKLVKTPVMGQS